MANDLYNAGRALGQGASMGWSDEAEAKARAAASGRPYEEELAAVRAEYAQFAADYPIAQPALEFVGGALPAVAAMLVPGGQVTLPANLMRMASPLMRAGAAIARTPGVRNVVGGLRRTGDVLADAIGYGKTVPQRSFGQNVGRATTIGGVQGAFGGAGASEDSRTMGAIFGAGLGVPLGAVSTLAPAALGAAGRYASQYLAPTAETIKMAAARRLSNALNMTPQEMQARVELDRAMGVPSLPLNVSPEATALAETMATRPGSSQSQIGRGIATQREGARERLASQIESQLAPASYFETRDAVTDSLRRSAAPAYEAAFSVGAIDDPRILDYLNDPEFRKAFDVAKELADKQAREARRQGLDPTPFEMEQVYRSTGVVDPERLALLQQMGLPEDMIARYINDLGPAAMTTERVALPNVRTLDYMKRGLDVMIQKGMAGDPIQRENARLLRQARNNFVARLDEVVPEYKAARQQYAGEMEVLEALDEGFQNFQKMKPEEVSSAFKNFSAAEQNAYRIGVARNLWGQLMEPSAEADYARRLINSPSTKMKLQAIFPSQAQYDLFEKALQRESGLFKDATRVLGLSPTARRTAALEAFEADPMFEAATTLATQGFEGGLTAMVMNALSKGTVSDDVAKQLAEWLTADDPTKLAAAVDALTRFGAQQAQVLPKRFGLSVGVTGGTLGAGFPAPDEANYAPGK